jgi:hypothetical protein
MLVDPRFARPSMRDKTLSVLDSQIDTILNSDMSDDVKVQNYAATLRRHRNYSDESPPKMNPLEKLEPDVIRSMPQNRKYKAKRLIKRLKQQKEVEWTSDGELVHRQTKIPKSDIVELIGDVLDEKSSKKSPIGWEALASGLKAADTPRELIPNVTRWNFMQGKAKQKDAKSKRKAWIHY